MTKSTKLRVGNQGEPWKEIREFWLLEDSVSLNPHRKQQNWTEREFSRRHRYVFPSCKNNLETTVKNGNKRRTRITSKSCLIKRTTSALRNLACGNLALRNFAYGNLAYGTSKWRCRASGLEQDAIHTGQRNPSCSPPRQYNTGTMIPFPS